MDRGASSLPPRAAFACLALALALLAPAWPARAAAPAAAPPAPAAGPGVAPLRDRISEPLHDDLDGLLRRGRIRVAVTYSKTHFFVHQGRQHGIAYEALVEFERFLRARHGKRYPGKALSVVFLPVPRDELLTRLREGRADLAAANLTVTPEREALVDFARPVAAGVREVVVTRAGAAPLPSAEALSGREVMVRPSSSFHGHLLALNARLAAAGKPPVTILPADEHLETEDLLEMVNAGLVDATVADDHVAALWSQIFKGIQVHPEAAVAEGAAVAWAVRKDAPRLRDEVSAFMAGHRIGTTFGNVLKQRYLDDTFWARRALDDGALGRFDALVELFRRYGGQYGFDHLMLMAQAFQESGLDHACKSPAGAIGIMQLLPSTGAAMKVGDIRQLDANVHAGAKYLKSITDQYFADPAIGPTDRVLLGFAAYNAGPNRIAALRRRAAAAGLDPNVWFGHVEAAVAQAGGMETVHYVSNISKYYLAYRMVENRRRERRAAEEALRER